MIRNTTGNISCYDWVMATVHDLRAVIMAYSSIEEATTSTGFRSATFKVGSKGIIGIEKDATHVTFALREEDAKTALERPSLAAEAIMKGEKLIGIRIDLRSVTSTELHNLVARSLASL